MATVNEKLATLISEALPTIDESIAQQPLSVRMGIEGLRPTLERRIDEYLARDPAELDAALENAIDFLARLRSDGARSFSCAVRCCPAARCATGFVAREATRVAI